MKIPARTDEEGVSEAIGFIIIFGIVMAGIAIITLYGYPMLLQQQSNADVRNMEQTMVVLQNDVKALCYKNVPYKETSLQVGGGVLAVESADPTGERFNISVQGNQTATKDIHDAGLSPFSPGMLVYTADDQDAVVAMENGAVIRAQAGGSTMLAEPRWYTDDDSGKTLVINLINLNSTGSMARSGMGEVRLKLDDTKTGSVDAGAGMTVEVVYTPADPAGNFSKAWENYLTGTLGMTQSGDTYTLTGVNHLIIKKYEIQVLSL